MDDPYQLQKTTLRKHWHKVPELKDSGAKATAGWDALRRDAEAVILPVYRAWIHTVNRIRPPYRLPLGVVRGLLGLLPVALWHWGGRNRLYFNESTRTLYRVQRRDATLSLWSLIQIAVMRLWDLFLRLITWIWRYRIELIVMIGVVVLIIVIGRGLLWLSDNWDVILRNLGL